MPIANEADWYIHSPEGAQYDKDFTDGARLAFRVTRAVEKQPPTLGKLAAVFFGGFPQTFPGFFLFQYIGLTLIA
jgi:hypothetical protein